MQENMLERIAQLLSKGKSSADIARTIDRSAAYVCKFLKANNLKPNIRPKFGSYEFECSVCGKNFIPISRSVSTCGLNCKKIILSKASTNFALKQGAQNVITAEKEALILAMRSNGKSVKDIEIQTGLSNKSIRQYLYRKTDMSTLDGNDKYNKKMTTEEQFKAIAMSKEGVHVRQIANILGYSETSMRDFLKKEEENLNVAKNSHIYNRRMDSEILSKLLSLHSKGKNVTEISKEIDFSPPAIRSFLRKRSIKPNISLSNISRPCAICGTVFVPKYSDGIAKDIYKACGKNCSSLLRSRSKTKYNQEDIAKTIEMAKAGYSNETIVSETGMKISKVKEIVTANSLYRTNFPGGSAPENEVKMFIESLGLKADKFRFPDLEGGKEIDIVTTLDNGTMIGIEYCGLYWHSEGTKAEKARNMHVNKLRKANNLGISLLTVFSDEWETRQKQVKSFIKSKLQKNSKKMFARNLDLKTVPNEEANKFLDEYHIQGSVNIELAFGLYLGSELLAVMTASKHHRQGDGNSVVLSRLCFKEDISIAGGSSRLLKQLIHYAKIQNYNKIISWSDNRWSEGNVYKSLGFNLESELPVDYSYVYGNKRISKQSCQKKNLAKKGGIGNTEKEMALSLGLYRIWDCGKKRWIYNVI